MLRNRMPLLAIMFLLSVDPCYAAVTQQFDLGIESMRSHGYSVGIFIFMMIAIAVFVGIIIGYMRTQHAAGMKRGEKVLFIMIILGVVAAAVFAAIQLLDGFLF